MSETRELYTALAAHFDQHYPLKKGGAELIYVTGEQVVTRLNETLGVDGWSFEILEHGQLGDDLWVRGRLTAHFPDRTVVREQFGGLKTNRGMEFADALKGAATDAMKKAASLVGVALYLSDKDEHIQPGPTADKRVKCRACGKLVDPATTNMGECLDCRSAAAKQRQAREAALVARPTNGTAKPATPAADPPTAAAARTALGLPPEQQPTPIASEPPVVTQFYDACQAALQLDRAAVLQKLNATELKAALAARGYPNTKAGLFQLYDTLQLIVDDEQAAARTEAVEA